MNNSFPLFSPELTKPMEPKNDPYQGKAAAPAAARGAMRQMKTPSLGTRFFFREHAAA
jgi:hypothetical protein